MFVAADGEKDGQKNDYLPKAEPQLSKAIEQDDYGQGTGKKQTRLRNTDKEANINCTKNDLLQIG